MSKTQKKQTHSITPLADNVLLTKIEQKTESLVGIILPDSVDSERGLNLGKVIAVGDGANIEGALIPSKLKKGDTVLFGWGESFAFEGVEYILIKESQILARVSK